MLGELGRQLYLAILACGKDAAGVMIRREAYRQLLQEADPDRALDVVEGIRRFCGLPVLPDEALGPEEPFRVIGREAAEELVTEELRRRFALLDSWNGALKRFGES